MIFYPPNLSLFPDISAINPHFYPAISTKLSGKTKKISYKSNNLRRKSEENDACEDENSWC